MSLPVIFAVILVLMAAGYQIGLRRSVAVAGGRPGDLHSRPGAYGAYVALWAGLPALVLLALWLIFQPVIISTVVDGMLPDTVRSLPSDQVGLIKGAIENLAAGGAVTGDTEPYMRAAADEMVRLQSIGRTLMIAAVVALAAVGLFFALRRISKTFRARNRVETATLGLLIICSGIAIVTTIGIVLSMLFEALHFFTMVPPQDFFFGLVWDPGFAGAGSEETAGRFGLIPVLWGTIFISAIAMLVAVPIGLLAAIYLSEYADRRVRAWIKPILEILAGIPTVVYGFFALTTVGPFLRDAGAAIGLEVSATSALNAGLVMGIMIIPFVSSLSDDIINAVPQRLRDGSYGLGATRSETIRHVVLPAALPGIVGAVLLAVSRAIGETMIVVMAAGLAANLTLNPFESVTTVTVKIVKQLTGDLAFNSPQALVAFALGLTLFVVTLCLNIVALHIVRKYREHYE